MPDAFDPLLRKKRILQLTGVDASTLYLMIKRGAFPPPVIINPGQARELVAWPQSVYLEWRASLPTRMARPSRRSPYPRGPKDDKGPPAKAKPVIGRPQ